LNKTLLFLISLGCVWLAGRDLNSGESGDVTRISPFFMGLQLKFLSSFFRYENRSNMIAKAAVTANAT